MKVVFKPSLLGEYSIIHGARASCKNKVVSNVYLIPIISCIKITIDVSAEFSTSVSADYLLTVNRAMKLGPGVDTPSM